MIAWINGISHVWAAYMLLLTVQNSLFLGGMVGLLYLLRKHHASWLRTVALIGLCKLFFIPVIPGVPVERLSVLPLAHVFLTLPADTTAEPRHMLSGTALLMLGWLVIALSLLGRAVVRTYRLRRCFHRARPVEVCPDLDMTTCSRVPITFVQSSWDHSPLVFGFFKPRVVLPASWETWSAACQRVVVAHEVAHIRQCDQWVYLAQTVAQALHFFNPLVWVLNRRLCQYSEMACDDAAVAAAAVSQVTYTEHLLHIAQTVTVSRRLQPANLAVSVAYQALKQRIAYQLSTRTVGCTHTAMRWGVIAVVLLASIPFSWDLTALRHLDAVARVHYPGAVPAPNVAVSSDKAPPSADTYNALRQPPSNSHGTEHTLGICDFF